MLFAIFQFQAFPELIWKKKKTTHPISHNNIAENPKCFISWLIYFVIIDLLVNSTIIFFSILLIYAVYALNVSTMV